MTECSPDEPNTNRKDFICGVVEGFYGRPWTTEQRKDLFQKLKKWGMDMYVYAPKDDYKHRAYWRELYTVEEAEHLTSLISAAKAQGIIFCYALSPGLDITYSSQKEITTLKRKLEQVSQFGCTCFALLFDDIEPEMSESDKQVFQSFAHAQVSITNEIHQHLGCPRFLLCPTQYCSTRAVPTVNSSEYLNTLGTKLSQEIDIMWTGPKVISKTLTTECIEEITQVLRRPPVIWDNLHANDYDQKRIFLGPYCGRSPELIPLLRGVLTNPNCEYNANMIPIWTLAHWAGCTLDAPAHLESVSWDIELERESEQGVCDDESPIPLGKHVYHHRQALRLAINEWLPEFSIPKSVQGPIIKPQPPVSVPAVPILPSVNTCMSLAGGVTTAPTVSTAVSTCPPIPTVSATTLQALAECADRPPQVSAMETFNPVSNPVMNSLVSPTKVILNESIPNPIIPIASSNISIPTEIPVSTLTVPILGIKTIENMEKDKDENEVEFEEKRDIVVDDVIEENGDAHRNGDMSIGDTPLTLSPNRVGVPEPLDVDPPSNAPTESDVVMNDGMSENGSMQVEPSNSPLSTDMMVEPSDPEPSEVNDDSVECGANSCLSPDDLLLLCELFYLPFEHGARGLRLMHDFNWLLTHATTLLKPSTPEGSEWVRRRSRFAWWAWRVRRAGRRLRAAPNQQLHAELQPYVWDLAAVLALLDAFLRWLELGKFPSNISSYTQGSYTWFSKGWREAFESGAQEPWVFRGGLTADLRRLLPVECSGDVLRPQLVPSGPPLTVRPYTLQDEEAVCELCRLTCKDGSDGRDLFPSDLQSLPSDRLIQPFLTLSPELCMVIEDDEDAVYSDGDDTPVQEKPLDHRINGVRPEIVGYACAAFNSKEFYRKQEIAWTPAMREKYPLQTADRDDLTPIAKEYIRWFHMSAESSPSYSYSSGGIGGTVGVGNGGTGGGVVTVGVGRCRDPLATHRLLTCLLAALRANGATGVHACVTTSEPNLHQLYSKLGFVEINRQGDKIYLARSI